MVVSRKKKRRKSTYITIEGSVLNEATGIMETVNKKVKVRS
jgi:hypothetical protein